MTDRLLSITKQRGKAVVMLGVFGFVQTMVHPETAAAVWPALGLAFGALGAMEAFASKGAQ